MSFIYTCILIICAVYFSVRRFDVFSLAFYGLSVYSMPLIFGEYASTTIAIYLISMLSIVMASIIRVNEINYFSLNDFLRDREKIIHALLVATSIYVLTINGILSKTSKIDVDPSAVGVSGALHAMFLQLSLLHLYFYWSRMWAIFIALNYLAIVLSGDRTQIVLSSLMMLTLHLSVKKYSLLQFVKANLTASIATFSALIIFGVFGKAIYGMYFQYNDTQNFNVSEMYTYIELSIQKLESVHVMSLLDWVVRDQYQINSEYLLSTVGQLLPFSFGNEINSHYIPDYFKSMYFTFASEGYGTSANFYAEGYLNSGFIGVLIFIALHVAILASCATILKAKKGWLVLIGVLSVSVVGFYIHRLSLFQLIAFEKRIFYFIVLLLCLGLFEKLKIRFGRE